MVRWASSTEFTGGCCADCKEAPDGEQSVSEKDAELGVVEKNVASFKPGNCCGSDACDVDQLGKKVMSHDIQDNQVFNGIPSRALVQVVDL